MKTFNLISFFALVVSVHCTHLPEGWFENMDLPPISLKKWSFVTEDILTCLDKCNGPQMCPSHAKLHLLMEDPTNDPECVECIGRKCNDPNSPYDQDCAHQAYFACESCPKLAPFAFKIWEDCHACRESCITEESKAELAKMQDCTDECKESLDCDDEPSRLCNECIFEECKYRLGAGCSVAAQCKCDECPPYGSYKKQIQCRRCYMKCGYGVSGGPAKERYFETHEVASIEHGSE